MEYIVVRIAGKRPPIRKFLPDIMKIRRVRNYTVFAKHLIVLLFYLYTTKKMFVRHVR